MHQIAEYRQRRRFGVTKRQLDRVADAKTHAEVLGANDIDGMLSDHWRYSTTLLKKTTLNLTKLLCIVKSSTKPVKRAPPS